MAKVISPGIEAINARRWCGLRREAVRAFRRAANGHGRQTLPARRTSPWPADSAPLIAVATPAIRPPPETGSHHDIRPSECRARPMSSGNFTPHGAWPAITKGIVIRHQHAPVLTGNAAGDGLAILMVSGRDDSTTSAP